MPQSVEGAGLATLVLALALVVCLLALRRLDPDDTSDAFVVLWRRWGSLGRLRSGKEKQRKGRGGRRDRKEKQKKPKSGAKAKGGASRPAQKKGTRRSKGPARKPAPKTRPAAKRKPPVAKRKPPAPRATLAESTAEVPRPPKSSPEPESSPEPKSSPEKEEEDVSSEPQLEEMTASPTNDDHMPLTSGQPEERKGEPKLLLRQRFRRGLRRTRERFGAELREAFTGGVTPEALDRLEETLVAADVGVATATALVDDMRQQIGLSDRSVSNVLKEVMTTHLDETDRRLRLVRDRLSVWVVVGVNGTGKTTTIAKLAARADDLGIKVCLAAADTFRAAAVEQLGEWGKRLQVDVVKQAQGADPGAVVFDAIAHARAEGHRLLIVDTAGRLHTRKPLMDELQKVMRVIDREDGAVITECLLVVDATTGQNGISQANAFKEAASVTGLVLAKLDGTAKGGITFAVERELGVPVKAVGVGETAKDLVPFQPEEFVEALIGEVE